MTKRFLSVLCILGLALMWGCSKDRRGEAERTADRAAERTDRAMGRTGQAVDDATVTTKVKAQLTADEGLRTLTGISVDTDHGVVRLTGEVPTEAMRERVETVARSVDGVTRVQNDLKVKPAR
ncbi:MAG TPA: BON domain-containing protein [Bryobacteraceae bacterium]|nr:BON domain-containing protein [Bryobacteraceae bacterium]